MSHFVGIDVGGTTSTIAIGSQDGQVAHVSQQFGSRTADGPRVTIAAILDEVAASLSHIGSSLDQVSHLGLATPGPATTDGVLLNTPNFNPELWNGFPFRGALQDAIRAHSPSAPVHYIGDGQAAALGEYSIRSGSMTWERLGLQPQTGRSLSSLFMVIVGTGLGGGEVQAGRVVRGKQGRAGHAGHIFLPAYAFRHDHDRQLTVGNADCTLESAVSLTALTHQLGYRLTLDPWRDHPLALQPGSMRDKAKRLRSLAAEGDKLALELFHDQARALGIGLLAINYLGDYDLIVIGGGVCDLAPTLREQYRSIAECAYRDFALDGFRNIDRFEFSACGDNAPVIGALAYAKACAAES